MNGPDATGDPTSADHPGDLLSGFIDDELDAGARQRVAAHLDDCPDCRDEIDAARAAKTRVGALPEVEGGGAVGRYVSRHRAGLRIATGFVFASSMIVVALGVTASVERPAVAPAVDSLMSVHAATPEAVGMAAQTEPDASYSAPAALLGNRASLSRRGVYSAGPMAIVVYRSDDRVDDPSTVTVGQEHGRIDWRALPAGDQIDIGERRVWSRRGSPTVFVTEIGDLVVTVVSDDRAAALTVVNGLPEVRRGSTYDRVHDACQRLTRVFALGE